MKYGPTHERSPLPYSPFKSCTVRLSIGWLTASETGPYSQLQNLTLRPANGDVLGEPVPGPSEKDTVLNMEQTGWFVGKMATYELREAVNFSAMALSFEENEFDRAGSTNRYAELSPTPVAESPAHVARNKTGHRQGLLLLSLHP